MATWAKIFVVNVLLLIALLELSLRIVPIPGFSEYIKSIVILSGQREGRRTDPEGGMGVFIPNRTFTWKIMDGSFDVTTVPFPDNPKLGLRDDGLDAQALYKVFACGDSFTFGYGVNDANVWHEILEKGHQGVVDIFNLRGIGSSVREIYERYPNYKDRFPHDTVFLGIYLGNEFAEAGAGGENLVTQSNFGNGQDVNVLGNHAENNSLELLIKSVYSFIRHHSYAARLVKYLLFKELIKIGYYNYDVKREVYQPSGSPFVFTIDYEEDILVRTCEIKYSQRMAHGVQAFQENLRKLVEIIRRNNKRIYAFIFPFKEQVYWEQWIAHLEHPEKYDRLKPNKIVAAALEKLEVEYFDLTYDMIKEGKSEELYWPIDSHWNEAGNRLAAQLIQMWLNERGFLARD